VRGKRRGKVVWRAAILWPPFTSPCTGDVFVGGEDGGCTTVVLLNELGK